MKRARDAQAKERSDLAGTLSEQDEPSVHGSSTRPPTEKAKIIKQMCHAAEMLLNNEQELRSDSETDKSDITAVEALAGAEVVNRVTVSADPASSIDNDAVPRRKESSTPNNRNEYDETMIPPDPVTTSTSYLGDAKKVKSTFYQRRSNSTD